VKQTQSVGRSEITNLQHRKSVIGETAKLSSSVDCIHRGNHINLPNTNVSE